MKKRNKLIRIGAIVALFSVVTSAVLSTTVTAGAVDEGKIIESVKGKIADIGQTQEVAYITARCCLMEWDLTTDKSRSFGVHAHGPYMDTADITISPWVGSLLDDDDDFDMLSFGGRDTTPSGQALLNGDVFHLGSFSIRGPITDHVYFSINFEDKVQVDLNTGPTVEYYLTSATGNGSVECNDIDNVFAKFAKALTNKSSVTGNVFETTIDEVLCGVDDPDFDIPGIVNCGGESKIDASKDYSFRSNDSIKKTILGLYNRYIREQGWFKGEMKSTACFPTSNECEKSDTVADLGYFDTVAGYGLYLRDIAGVTYSGSIYGADEHYVDGNCGAIDYTDAQLMGLKILKGSVPEKGLPGGRLVSSDEDVMYFREYPNGNKNMYSFVGKVNGSSQPSCNDLVTAANKLALNETISGSRRDILDVYAHVLDSECYTAFSHQASYAQQRLTAYENKLAERQKTDPNAEYDQVEAEAVINLSNIINEFNSIKSDGEIKEGSSRLIFGGSDDTVMPRTNYYFIKIFDPADETKGMACKDDLEYLDTVDEMKYYDPATLEEEYDGEGCYDGNGALTWFACPMIVHLGDAVQGFYEDHIEPALLFDTRMLTYRAGADNGTDAGFNAPDNTACSTVNESSDCQTCAESRNNGVYDEQACEACDEAKKAAGCSTNAEDYASEISDADDVSSYAATANTYSVTRRLWNSVRTLANIGFFLIVVIVVFSQVTGFGLDNYNIKKILPKLVVSVVLINLSYVICAAAVDASNILGLAVKWLLIRATDGIGVVDGNYGSALAVIGIIVGLMVASAVLAQGWAIIFPVLAALLAGLICILFLFVVIYLRLLLIIACVVISPLAMVCYTLPNTKKLFDTWFNTFAKALLCFPLASFLVYGGRLGAVLLLAVSQGASSMQKAIVGIAALGVMVGPVLKIRSTIEGSFGMLKGAVAGLARVQGGLTRSAGNALNNNDIAREMRMNHQQNRAQNRLERRAGVRLDANGNIVERTPRTRLGRAFRRAADLANTHLPGQAARQKNQARARMMFAAQYDREAAYSQFAGDAGRQNLINKLSNTDERTEQQAVENERLSMLSQYDNGRVSSLINDTSGLKSIMDSSRTSTVPADQQQRRARAIVQQLSQSGDGLEELSRMVRGIGDYGGADYQTSRRELMNYMAADSGLMAKFEAEDGAAAQYIKDMYTGSTYTTGGTTYGANDHTFDSWASGTDTERGGNNMEFAFQQTVKKSQKFAEQGDYAMDDFLAFAQTGQRAQRDANGNATRDSKGGYIGDGTNIASTSQDTRLAQLLNVGSRADFSNKGKNESKIAGAYGAVKFSTSADSAGRAIQQFNAERRKRGGS